MLRMDADMGTIRSLTRGDEAISDLKLETSEWGVCRAYGAWLLYAIAYPALTGWANCGAPPAQDTPVCAYKPRSRRPGLRPAPTGDTLPALEVKDQARRTGLRATPTRPGANRAVLEAPLRVSRVRVEVRGRRGFGCAHHGCRAPTGSTRHNTAPVLAPEP
jgi:hypothetical protein